MRYVDLGSSKWYYIIDGHLMEFNSQAELNEFWVNYHWETCSLFRSPKDHLKLKKHRKRTKKNAKQGMPDSSVGPRETRV